MVFNTQDTITHFVNNAKAYVISVVGTVGMLGAIWAMPSQFTDWASTHFVAKTLYAAEIKELKEGQERLYGIAEEQQIVNDYTVNRLDVGSIKDAIRDYELEEFKLRREIPRSNDRPQFVKDRLEKIKQELVILRDELSVLKIEGKNLKKDRKKYQKERMFKKKNKVD